MINFYHKRFILNYLRDFQLMEIISFSNNLARWYETNKRDLPWRKTSDPYIIWISEIILQQTRVDQGIGYFLRFVDRFPDVLSLAKASEQDVLKLWQGLGYYSRARNLKSAAEYIVDHHKGVFPVNHADILKLKGVGSYTAAAIASFAYKQCYPVIDGNVMRVIARLYGIEHSVHSGEGKRLIAETAQKLIDKKEPDIYNQAIMEFGALQCTPSSPNCENCIFSIECVAYNTGKVSEIPRRKSEIIRKNRYFNYVVIRDKNRIILKKRSGKDIWQNMFDFPLIESNDKLMTIGLKNIPGLVSEKEVPYKTKRVSEWKTHLLSHQKIHARFHELHCDVDNFYLPVDWKIVQVDEIKDYPLPKLIETYINGD